MSLINQNEAFKTSDFLFLSLGVAGLLLFFLTYSFHDPRSTVDRSPGLENEMNISSGILESLGYEPDDFVRRSDFRSNRRLLDTLQYRKGRLTFIKNAGDSAYSGLYPYYRVTRLSRQGTDKDGEGKGIDGDSDDKQYLSLHLDEQGRWFEFINRGKLLPRRKVNRPALIYAFESDSTLDLWKSIPDSSWDKVMNFRLDEDYDVQNMEKPERRGGTARQVHEYSSREISRLARYYLENSAWNADRMKLADIQVRPVRERMVAELKFEGPETALGKRVVVNMSVLPGGSLLSLQADYQLAAGKEGPPSALDLLHVFVLFLVGIGGIILFYFRIRSRVIDTKPALVVSILAGLLIPATIFLENVGETSFFTNSPETMHFLELALRMGFSGALASVGFFIAFALGDSITRQHWPEKLISYDYLRQGMFFNKPVGETILRAGVLAGILCGIWTVVLYFFPNLYFEVYDPFLHYKVSWAPLYLFLEHAWYSLLMVTLIFLVVGAQIYASSQNKWFAAAGMVFGVSLMTPLLQGFGPQGQEFLLFALVGIALAFIFLKWDFLTVLLTHFLFLGFVQTAAGWIVEGSPDQYVFGAFLFVTLLLMGSGVLFLRLGKEQGALPRYVPDYVEELAQEERIKQELQIARQVQQSFLPVRTPDLQGLDIAALCQPAYETGGDYYDFIQLDDQRVALAIGDVSGKGVPAAFYMTFTKGILHSLCRETDSPAELLKKANRLFVDNARKGTFISLVYGIIDIGKRTFTFSRAGHNPVLYYNAAEGKVIEHKPTGLGIGLTRDANFDNNIKEVKLSLSPADVLVLYTDGIVEALSATHQFYGSERLNHIIKEHKHKRSRDILTVLSDDVIDFIGTAKQHDDMTIMVVKLDRSQE